MSNHNRLTDFLFNINSEKAFNERALEIFKYQFEHVSVYRDFCLALGRTNPSHYLEIPFLPISFFKTHKIISDELEVEKLLTFKSSGTTQSIRSKHYVASPKIYEDSFLATFTEQITPPKDAVILALLPNYIEQGDSSLVYMVDDLVKRSSSNLSGFYLSNPRSLIAAIQKAKEERKTIVLFGVSYALLDLAETGADLSDVMIIETGGMKGRRKEMIKQELHEVLCQGLKVSKIYSEYGMTELLSQAYTDGTEFFTSPPWMKAIIRDINDPLSILPDGKTGGVNIIDFANYYSCSFIATDDLGVKRNNQFKVMGRFDQSDIRGCNLLVN